MKTAEERKGKGRLQPSLRWQKADLGNHSDAAILYKHGYLSTLLTTAFKKKTTKKQHWATPVPSIMLQDLLQHTSPSPPRLADQWEVGLPSASSRQHQNQHGRLYVSRFALVTGTGGLRWHPSTTYCILQHAVLKSLLCIPLKHTLFPNSTWLLWASGGWQKPFFLSVPESHWTLYDSQWNQQNITLI